MNLRSILLTTVGAALAVSAHAQKKYTFTSAPNDPMQVRIYTLDNGLKVYLSKNEDEPRIQTNIAVRAGSKFDPADATGLAHYLEHMLFKGTHEIATQDWATESKYIAQISDLYEQRRRTSDPAERDAIYARIDSLSGVAAQYAVPNEYDKMISSIGAKGTNAYTSTEQTVYVNDIPTNAQEKWMMIESVRFRELVLRLFHTELETVFEEFNRGQDNDYRKVYEAMNRAMYKKHPYGTQTTIGTGEDLKNPSMVKIHQYFDTYYVPNNMAIIMAGDLDYDATIALVDKYFGGWKSKPVPAFHFTPEDPIMKSDTMSVYGPMAASVSMGWRFGGTKTEDPMMLDLIAGIMSNGQAGLIDLDLVQQQKVLQAYASSGEQADYSEFSMGGDPKEGQSLEEVRTLLLAELDKLKKGEFDDWLISAVVNDKRQQQIRYWNERNNLRASALTDAFILGKDWKDVVSYYDRMAKITKEQVVAFAKANFNHNDVTVFKRVGEDTTVFHVEKPKITPLKINRDAQSEWYKRWAKVPEQRLQPQFVDYATAILRDTLKSGIPLAIVPNKSNDLFTLTEVLDLGNFDDPKLKLAVNYLSYLGTSTMSAEDLQKEFFKLGLSFGVNAGQDRVQIYLSGLEQNMGKGMQLMEALLNDPKPNVPALQELVKDMLKERADNLKNKNYILYGGMASYARYGERSPLRNIQSAEELKAVTPEELIGLIKGINSHPHRFFYYGKKSRTEIADLLNKEHRVPAKLVEWPQPAPYVELPTTGNKVYYVDYDMVQTELMLMSKDEPFNMATMPYASLFNEYFGSGLSSIVFQEIREAKALAYSAYAAYTMPAKKEEASYVRAYVGTQSDKLGQAEAALSDLMNNMPQDERMFAGSKDAALKKIESSRTTKESIYWSWEAAQRRGLDEDINRILYPKIQQSSLAGLADFFDKHIKGRNYTFLAIGKESSLDMEALRKLGPVQKLTLKELFGYDGTEQ
ncbi:MAG: insulinase family protein [Flavobacteriales bacterium]|nr:insulinase family protein [Flavobacteriales bacterium]